MNENGFNLKWDDDIKTEEERALSNIVGEAFFVTMYPSHHKPFYVKINEDDPKWCFSADLMAPEGFGEIITGDREKMFLILLFVESKKKVGMRRITNGISI